MFTRMKDGIQEETVRQLFLVRRQLDQGPVRVEDPADSEANRDDEGPGQAVPQATIGG